MPTPLTSDLVQELLQKYSSGTKPVATSGYKILFTDVFIAGSGSIGSTYARTIIDNHPTAKVFMADLAPQDSPLGGAHQKAVPDSIGGILAVQGSVPSQVPGLDFRSLTTTTQPVGRADTHLRCVCSNPHEEEIANNPIPRNEFTGLLERAGEVLNAHDDQYDNSIRHTVVKEALQKLPKERNLGNLTLGVERRKDNPESVTWTSSSTILGKTAGNPRFELHNETRVTRLVSFANDPSKIGAAWLLDLNTREDVLVIAKAFVVCCGAIGNPQILWNSNVRPPTLGRYLSEQVMAFCQVILNREIIDSISNDPRFSDRVKQHKKEHPSDPLPIPLNDPEPQVTVPYTSEHPWHVEIHGSASSDGTAGSGADYRVVVDLRFFGKLDVKEGNRLSFEDGRNEQEAGIVDSYGMPQPTFQVEQTEQDTSRSHKMMNDMTNIANMLGGYLPGSYPQFKAPEKSLHITGTTRIGTDPKTSVASADSKVHNFKNLWVGGNSVIPDAIATNPTRTGVAYALKGADAVVQYLKEGGSN